jgi:aspartate aminotransferase-like enzyme
MMEGKAFRVGHLGSIHEDDVDAMLASLTAGLTAFSRRVGVHLQREPSRHRRSLRLGMQAAALASPATIRAQGITAA